MPLNVPNLPDTTDDYLAQIKFIIDQRISGVSAKTEQVVIRGDVSSISPATDSTDVVTKFNLLLAALKGA